MSRTRTSATVAGLCAGIFALSGCGGEPPASGQDYVGSLEFSLALGEGSHHHVGAAAFADKLEELTDGRIQVNFYYNNALGGEREAVEGMSIGSIDMGMASTGPMGGFVDEFLIFDLPYLFDDHQHAWSALDGETGEELAGRMYEQADVKILAWMENGFRHETNSVRAVSTPADLADMNHRTQESRVQIDTWSALGANATPMAWPEVYTALQQGVMDSQENPLPTILDMRFYEVQDHLVLTEHTYSPAPLMISGEVWNQMSTSDQQALTEAAEHALPVQRQESVAQEDEAKQILVEQGMELTEPDLDSFRAAVEPVYDTWAPELGEDLIRRARAAEG